MDTKVCIKEVIKDEIRFSEHALKCIHFLNKLKSVLYKGQVIKISKLSRGFMSIIITVLHLKFE